MNLARRIMMARRMCDTSDCDPYWGNVVLLLKGDGPDGSTNIIDSSVNSHSVTVYEDARIKATQSKFGDSSLYFDGTGDYMSVVSPYLALGTDDFTVETWFYIDGSLRSNGLFHLAASVLPGTVSGISLGLQDNAAGNVVAYWNGTWASSGIAPTNFQWNHVAMVRNSGNGKVYLNGQSIMSFSDPANYADTALTIGAWHSVPNAMKGYLDDFRITKGVARYTTNFTPPTEPFPTTGP